MYQLINRIKNISTTNLVICFSNDSLVADIWTNKQHLMTRLSKMDNYFVIYVDQGMSSRDIKNVFSKGKISYFFNPIKFYNDSLINISPYFLPLIKGGCIKRYSWIMLRVILNRIINYISYERLIYWIYQPQSYYYFLDSKYIDGYKLYDCVDDFKSQPFYSSNQKRKNELINIETKLIGNMDLITTTSNDLYKEKLHLHNNVHYVHNVGDYKHFNIKEKMLNEVNSLKDIHDPIVMYTGVIDDYKLDIDFIFELIKQLNNYHFVFIGPVRVKKSETTWNNIMKANNVSVLGTKSYKDLPSYLNSASILLLPYALNEHTRFVFPIKLFEYMATGKYIVARNMPSYKLFSKFFKTYKNLEEAVISIGNYNNNKHMDKRIELAKSNDWHSRLNKILHHIF